MGFKTDNSKTGEEGGFAKCDGLDGKLLDNGNIMGFGCTQLYDIEQEESGLMYYDRRHKFNPKVFCEFNIPKTAIYN